MDLQGLFEQEFFEVFNESELKEIYKNSLYGDGSCYIICNKKYWFELTVDFANELEIYYLGIGTRKIIEKTEFLNKLRAYPIQKIKVIEV